MSLTEQQWESFHLFLLDLYPLKNVNQIQQYVLEKLEVMIPHKRSFFDLGTVKNSEIHFFHPMSLNISKELLKKYYADYQQRDYATWYFSAKEPAVYLDSALVPDASRELSPIYREWMKPMDAYYGLGCTIVKEYFYGSITLFRSKEEGDFNSSEHKLLEYINLHLSSHLYNLFPVGIGEQCLLEEEEPLRRIFRLSKRETEIVKLAAAGKSNQEIAQSLCISETTVKKHISHIFEKMQVSNRSQLQVKLRERFLDY